MSDALVEATRMQMEETSRVADNLEKLVDEIKELRSTMQDGNQALIAIRRVISSNGA